MKASIQRVVIFMALALLFPVALTGCGGGVTTAGGGTGGTGVGPVTGFGSVIVNGVHYDDRSIDNTNFFDDHGRTKSGLMTGMMVAISGRISGANGTADNITVLRHVDGPMDDNGVELATNRLKVMGQDVVVDASTVFDNGITSLADLRTLQGANVNHPELEVHGSADNTGVIHATFIHKWSDDRIAERNVQVRGTVSGLNTAARTFSIGRKTVDYNALGTIHEGVDNGSFVEAEGTLRASDNALVATQVKLEDATGGQPSGSRAEVEGYVNRVITQAAGSGSFELIGPNGVQTVTWTSGTTTPEGGTLSDILAGVKVEVEGVRKAGGALAATKIEIRRASNIKFETTVADPQPSSFRLFGIQVKVNALTQYEDSRDGDKFFTQTGIHGIQVGDTLEVSAYLDNAASIVATRVERIVPIASDRHILQGPVDSIVA
ncbi:MAG TPA: DUF5666 domain-containing protein, partial [Thermodesulfobacteriota bacterium]|nr:DUF5666 domain-containing protein [Thermodesulfobacteriota bacterium]